MAPFVAASVYALAAPPAALVWLVRYDPRMRYVPVGAGENSGHTLPHRNIVRELVRLGSWSASGSEFSLPPPREAGLAAAILLQQEHGGAILAARRI